MKKLSFLSFFAVFLFTFFSFQAVTNAAEVSAWLPSWGVEEAFESFQDNKDTIDVISPFWYHVNQDGTLSPTQNSEDMEIINFAKENNIPVIPTISNSYDGKKISGFLNDPVERTKNIQNIVSKVIEFDYDGIDIDYEGLLSADKEVFTAYIKELDEALEFHGKKLTIAVMAKSYSMMPFFGERGQDWAELGKYVDEFRIMTYDYGWSGSAPRPVGPYYWAEEVIQYAVDHVPAEKIRLGIPYYGYAWSDNGVDPKEFSSYTYQSILDIVDTYDVDFQYDPRERVNRLFYLSQYDTRNPVEPFEIWFENHVSLQPKLELVKKYNLGGIAIWRLGREDTENWPLIRHYLKDVPAVPYAYFDDVTPQTPYVDSIHRLAWLGLVQGQGDTGLFEPESLVNRAEILKMALNSFALDTSDTLFPETQKQDLLNPFPDVDLSSWYQAYIRTALAEGVIEGYPDGYFRPESNIIRVEALKLALESSGLDLSDYDNSEWYFPYRDWAIVHGLYSPDNFVPGEQITRAEAAYIMDKVMEVVEREPQYSTYNQPKDEPVQTAIDL